MMHTRRLIKWFLAASVYILIAHGLAPSCYAADKTVTIGYVRHASYLNKEADGSLTGYGADYLNKIAEYTGWKYNFVEVPQSGAFNAVKDGDTDLLFGVDLSDEQQPDYGFSIYPAINELLNLYTLPGSDYYYDDFKALDGIRIGISEDINHTSYLEHYAEINGFSYTLLQYPDNECTINAMENGEVDAAVLI